MHTVETTGTTHEHEDDDPPRPGVVLGRTRNKCAVWGAEMAPTPVGFPYCAVTDARQIRNLCNCASHRRRHHQTDRPSCVSRRVRVESARARPLKRSGSRMRPAAREAQTVRSRASTVAKECQWQCAPLQHKHKITARESAPSIKRAIRPNNYAKIRDTCLTWAA